MKETTRKTLGTRRTLGIRSKTFGIPISPREKTLVVNSRNWEQGPS